MIVDKVGEVRKVPEIVSTLGEAEMFDNYDPGDGGKEIKEVGFHGNKWQAGVDILHQLFLEPFCLLMIPIYFPLKEGVQKVFSVMSVNLGSWHCSCMKKYVFFRGAVFSQILGVLRRCFQKVGVLFYALP